MHTQLQTHIQADTHKGRGEKGILRFSGTWLSSRHTSPSIVVNGAVIRGPLTLLCCFGTQRRRRGTGGEQKKTRIVGDSRMVQGVAEMRKERKKERGSAVRGRQQEGEWEEIRSGTKSGGAGGGEE